MVSKLNAENKCAKLYKEYKSKSKLEDIFRCQSKLQVRLKKHPKEMNFMEKISYIKDNMICINSELNELLDRLPWKYWKKYSKEQKLGFVSKEQKLETQYEAIDIAHFFINICLALDIDAKIFYNLYRSKNEENFDRQKRGY